MDAEDLLVDDGGKREAVEDVAKHAPQFDVVTPLALVVKPVDARDGVALVVASQQEEVLGVLHLVRQKQADHLQALLSAVHVIAQEQVIRLRREPAILKQPEQVRVLAVHVPADLQRRLQLQQARLRQENLSAIGAGFGTERNGARVSLRGERAREKKRKKRAGPTDATGAGERHFFKRPRGGRAPIRGGGGARAAPGTRFSRGRSSGTDRGACVRSRGPPRASTGSARGRGLSAQSRSLRSAHTGTPIGSFARGSVERRPARAATENSSRKRARRSLAPLHDAFGRTRRARSASRRAREGSAEAPIEP